jgi:hypothetical protein
MPMPSETSRNKIYVVGVICLGVVISIWLLNKEEKSVNLNNDGQVQVSARAYETTEKNDDWKKLLVNVDSVTETSVLSKATNAGLDPEGTTITDQVGRDFLSQYMLAVKNNGGITTSDVNSITENTIAVAEYNSTGAKYVSLNIKIINKNDSETLRIYRNKLYEIIKNRTSSIKDDPFSVIMNAMPTESEKELAKLNPIIIQNKAFIADLLKMEVPSSAATLHLSLLNASSNLLSNLEDMREIIRDPVRGLTGVGNYPQSITNLNLSLKNFTEFFIKNL